MSVKELWVRASAKRISFMIAMLAASATLVATATPSQTAPAQTEKVESPSAVREERFSPADSELQMSSADLESYIKGKYNVEIGVREEDANTHHRSKQRIINICGDISYGKAIAAKKSEHGPRRAAAEAFFAEEGERLFGVKDPADIREFSEDSNQYNEHGGIIVLRYKRYVGNLPLEDEIIQVATREDGSLAHVTAHLVPVTYELLEAVKKETLPEAQIREIIKPDLKQPGGYEDTIMRTRRRLPSNNQFPTAVLQQPRIKSWIEKEAIPAPPYVVWKVMTAWPYVIDAFSGKIIEKSTTTFTPSHAAAIRAGLDYTFIAHADGMKEEITCDNCSYIYKKHNIMASIVEVNAREGYVEIYFADLKNKKHIDQSVSNRCNPVTSPDYEFEVNYYQVALVKEGQRVRLKGTNIKFELVKAFGHGCPPGSQCMLVPNEQIAGLAGCGR